MLNKNIATKTYYFILLFSIFLGIFLRINAYLYNKSFWYDEAALALNVIDRNFLELLKPLDYVQCAPYLFLVASKIMTIISGTSEFVFRFLPLVFGIASIFLFYFLSKEILNKKWSILVANYLFAINFQLIYYCQEFKQYSLEVLITILSVIYLSKLDTDFPNDKKCIIFGFVFFSSFLFSMPQIIIFSAFILFIFFNWHKTAPMSALSLPQKTIRQIFLLLLPFLILLIPYYFLYLAPNKEIILASTYMWNEKYISLNLHSIKEFVINFYYFIFYPNHNQFMSLILTIIGIFYLYKDKKRANMLIILIVLTALIFAVLHLYPLHDRIALYMAPLMILIMIKPLDELKLNREAPGKLIVILNIFLLVLFYFCFRLNSVKYLSRFFNENIFDRCYARQFFEIIKEHPQDNIEIIFKDVNPIAYIYYLRQFGINLYKFSFLHKEDVQSGDDGKVFANFSTDKFYWLYTYKYNAQGADGKTLKSQINKKRANIIIEKRMGNLNGYAEIYLLKFK